MEQERRKMERPRKERMLAGVCAAIANYFGWDPTLVRIVYALLTVFTAFSGIIIYFILLLIIPEEPNRFFGR
ncbi:PspC domain-containing protein [Bacteroides sp. OF04-15BH]|jgi:phage shock protein C|uniref:PspC domain-containing protein n=1 Tax=Bacteroides sp. OF04-15BH TaxID=2292281 RepID=UPI000E46BC90|nr:PspC domain-containing protein [Bacteroides sp. OF04-15BH]RHP61806.1 PspC domain-containing protein [Bacteroides sp. OF04-15BH]